MSTATQNGRIRPAFCLTFACLLIAALTLWGAGDANPIGIGLFLGLFLGIPALIGIVWALLRFAAKPPRPIQIAARQYIKNGGIVGNCPNCEAVIPADSAVCPCCNADFGEYSAWKVRVHAQPFQIAQSGR